MNHVIIGGVEWQVRHEFDVAIIRDVVERDEYRLPACMDGWRVLDVGGHVGAFARLVAGRGANVVSCEPDPDNFALLLANTDDVRSRVRCIEAAVGAAEGRANLWLWGNPCCHTLTPGTGRLGPDVRVIGIDRLLAEPVDLLKIDAEGAEYVILSASELPGVQRLIVEFHGQPIGDAAEAERLRTRLATLGFRERRWERLHVESGLWFCIYEGER